MIVNGKEYPLWSQFVERKHEFVGGLLQDLDGGIEETEILNITLLPNGKNSAYFSVEGKDFDCGFDCGVGGIVRGEDGWITFNGYCGHTWRIKKILNDGGV